MPAHSPDTAQQGAGAALALNARLANRLRWFLTLGPGSRVSGVLALGLTSLLLSCAPPAPRAPNPVRPVDEARAVRIIANAMRDTGLKPVSKRTIQLPSGRSLDIDVGVSHMRFGIAYVTEQERSALEGTPEVTSPDALLVLRGRGPDTETRVLILRAENYMSDDNTVGDEHEASTVAAENRIDRDVRDFLAQARGSKWP